MRHPSRIGYVVFIVVILLFLTQRTLEAQVIINDQRAYPTYNYHTLKNPVGLAIGTIGLYIADTGNNVIRVFSGGKLTTIAGNGTAGYVNASPAANAEFHHPTGISILSGTMPNPLYPTCGPPLLTVNAVYIADSQNQVTREAVIHSPKCVQDFVSTVAGNGTQGFVNGSSTSSEFNWPGGMLNAPAGQVSLYIADAMNNAIRLWSNGAVTTYAGTGTPGLVNGPKAQAKFDCPGKITQDTAGNLYVADMDNHVIRKIDTSGNVTTFAGSGQPGYANGTGTAASFDWPTSVVFNPADSYLYVVDMMNNSIRRISLAGVVTTYAGSKIGGLVNGSLSQAEFACPSDLVIANGTMYISDTMNNVIRAIDMVHLTVSTLIS